jgi:adenosylhomocysteine nucleosidase
VILVFAAMEPEVRACFGGGAIGPSRDVAGFPVYEDNGLAVCQTGLGRRSHDAATSVLEHFKPEAVLSVGTAGGLNLDLRAGQLLACSHVHHAGMRGTLEETPAFSDERLLALALEVASGAEIEARLGSAVTVDEIAWTSAAKADLHAWMEHDVVEMESYWIGKAAAAAGLPYLALRVVTDQAADELVQTPAISADGTFDVGAFQAWIKDHPEYIPMFAQQADRSRRGLGTLAQFLSAFLPRLAGSHVS